jgi:hypothetical protein
VFHILANYAAVNSATLVQLNACADIAGYTAQNSAFVLVENYSLVGVFASGANMVQAQINDAYLNAINPFQIYPVNLALAPASNPNFLDLRQAPQAIPLNEQFMAQSRNAAGGAEAHLMLWWIRADPSPVNWQVVPGTVQNPRTFAIATATIVLTVGVWSPVVPITFTSALRGGAYQINNAWMVAANATAFRFLFPKQPFYNGRKMQAGGLCDAAYGNIPLRNGMNMFGPMGRFNYFEQPQVQAIGNATTGSTTYTMYLDLTWLGDAGPGVVPM